MYVMLFDYYTGVKMEPSNLWVDMMYSIVEFKIKVLEELLRVLSPNRRISWKRYIGDWLLIILNKQQSFRYQRLCWRDSNPNSWQSFL